MKRKKLLRKIKDLLSADRRKQIAKYDSLQKVLVQLAKKEEQFREKLEAEDDEERRVEIRRKLKAIEAQRRKGEALEQELEALIPTE